MHINSTSHSSQYHTIYFVHNLFQKYLYFIALMMMLSAKSISAMRLSARTLNPTKLSISTLSIQFQRACGYHLDAPFTSVISYKYQPKFLESKFYASTSTRLLSTSSDSKSSSESTIAEKESLSSKLKAMWSKYGYIAVGTYLSVYVCTLSSLFIVLDYDIINAASVGFEPTETIKKVCDLVSSYTGSHALPGFIKEYPRGNYYLSFTKIYSR